MTRPNVLFYFSDQQRADTCGCYGQRLAVTPVLDSLAADGVLFSHAFTAQPVCGPCRSLFQTGLYPTTTGCFRNNIALPLDTRTIAQRFEEAGYETAYVGKWHLASDGDLEATPRIDYHHSAIPLESRGGYTGFWRASDVLEFTSDGYGGYVFDENNQRLDFSGYRADCITDFALEFLERHAGQRDRMKDSGDDSPPASGSLRPFFLTISHIEPHHQNNAGHYQGPVGSRQRFKDFDVPGDLAPFEGDWRGEYPDYLGACERVDYNLGRVLDALKRLGLYEDTLIVYTSDHGSHFRTRNRDGHLHGFDDYKRTGHDAALRVPLVMRGNGLPTGIVVDSLVSTASLPRTLLCAAGLEADATIIGEDLAKLAQGDCSGHQDEVFAQISESRVGRVIRTRGYTYGVYAPGLHGGLHASGDVYADDYLYDLEKDPFQLTNRASDADYAGVKLDLRRRLLDWIRLAEHTEARIVD